MTRLSGKTALVTAAAAGIGRAVALAFVAEGARVIATDIDTGPLGAVGAADGFRLDVTDAAAVAALPERIGPVDILFNGAGVVHSGTIFDTPDDDWTRAFDLNVTAMFRLIRAFVPGMREAGGGSIVNVSSVASSILGVKGRLAYGASKAAVIGLTKAVAADCAPYGIRCNAICPGTIDTPSLGQRMAVQAEASGQAVAAVAAAFAARQAMGRLGRPEEVAALAVHLAGDESRFTTGTTAVIDGGWSVE